MRPLLVPPPLIRSLFKTFHLPPAPKRNSHFTQQTYFVTLKIEAARSPEKSVDFYQNSRRHISEDGISHYSPIVLH